MNKTCMLIVNGKNVEAENYVKIDYENRYAELPLIAVLEELGTTIEWEKDTLAKITVNNKSYFLDTVQESIVEEGKSFNMIIVPPGTTHGSICYSVDKEFIVDNDSIQYFISLIGAKISINYNSSIICVEN